MEIVKNSANEQVKMTQTWAQVVASAPASGNTSLTTTVVATVAPEKLGQPEQLSFPTVLPLTKRDSDRPQPDRCTRERHYAAQGQSQRRVGPT